MSTSKKKIYIHCWNVIMVKKFRYPMPNPIELCVKDETFEGAAAKAHEILISEEHINKNGTGWKIGSIWWLDPDRIRKDED